MKRIGNSKEPTTKQMLAMVENLREKLGVAASVQVDIWAFSSDSCRCEYGIYLDLDHKGTIRFGAWPKALAFYRKLINGGKSVWLEAKNV